MSSPSTKCTLHALFARVAPAAVIYRRSPSAQTCLIAWDRRDDSFAVGQWFKGTVKPSWGGLSPDGSLLVSHVGKHKGPFGTWTVLSRPPYFTALALWPKGDPWSGGGFFLSDRTLVLRHIGGPYALAPSLSFPPGLHVIPASEENRARIEVGRPVSPWTPHDTPAGSAIRRHPTGPALVAFARHRTTFREAEPASLEEAVRHRLLVRSGAAFELPVSGWAEFDEKGDLLFSEGGRLYRLKAEAIDEIAHSAELTERAICLADFSDLRFRPLPAPYAPVPAPASDAPAGFAPALDRTTREERRAAKRRRRNEGRKPLAVGPRGDGA